jgi:hypothetical protein
VAPHFHPGELDRGGTVLSGYQTEEELSIDLDVCVRTLRRWDARRVGPPRVLVGRKPMYRRDGVKEWLIKRERGFDNDQKKHRGKRGA